MSRRNVLAVARASSCNHLVTPKKRKWNIHFRNTNTTLLPLFDTLFSPFLPDVPTTLAFPDARFVSSRKRQVSDAHTPEIRFRVLFSNSRKPTSTTQISIKQDNYTLPYSAGLSKAQTRQQHQYLSFNKTADSTTVIRATAVSSLLRQEPLTTTTTNSFVCSARKIEQAPTVTGCPAIIVDDAIRPTCQSTTYGYR